MDEPRPLEEWVIHCAWAGHNACFCHHTVCQDCARAYAEREVAKERNPLYNALCRTLIHRILEANTQCDPPDDIMLRLESIIQERDTFLAVAWAAKFYLRCVLGDDGHYSSGPGKVLEDALAHTNVQRLLKEKFGDA